MHGYATPIHSLEKCHHGPIFFRVLATLKRKFNVLCLHVVLGTREDLSVVASISNVELIWTKLG